MIATFYNGHWARRPLSPAVGAKIPHGVCMSRSESGALFIRGGHILDKYCVTFYAAFIFIKMDSPFKCTREFSFFLLDGATIFFRYCCQKLRKVQKSAEKFMRTTFVKLLRDLKKKIHRSRAFFITKTKTRTKMIAIPLLKLKLTFQKTKTIENNIGSWLNELKLE